MRMPIALLRILIIVPGLVAAEAFVLVPIRIGAVLVPVNSSVLLLSAAPCLVQVPDARAPARLISAAPSLLVRPPAAISIAPVPLLKAGLPAAIP